MIARSSDNRPERPGTRPRPRVNPFGRGVATEAGDGRIGFELLGEFSKRLTTAGRWSSAKFHFCSDQRERCRAIR